MALLAVLAVIAATAHASGWPPFAFRDSIEVQRGGVADRLTTGEASVLANDFDFERDQLTVVLEKDAKRGELELREDGTFRYRHDGSKSDSDSFEYRAFDGTGFSRKTSVTIDIEDVFNTSPLAFPDSIEVQRGGVADRLTTGEASVLANDFDLERDELTVVLEEDVKQGQLELREDGTFRYRHDDGKSDSDSFEYRAFDGTSFSEATRVTIDIEDVPNTPPFVTAEVADQEALEGDAYRLGLAGNFDDMDEGDVLRFSARGLPNSGSLSIDATSGVLSGTPAASDVRDAPYIVEIIATDRAGASASLTFSLFIYRENRADIALSISLAANPITVGESAVWNIDVENRGPGILDNGQLSASWASSGPSLSLTAPPGCTIEANGTSAPEMSCAVATLEARTVLTFRVEGAQSAAGDNSLIGVFSSDDPEPGNNADLASAHVVAEFSEGPTQTVSVSGAGVDAGDLDGDGEIDVVTTSEETLIFFNDGNRAVRTPGVGLGADTGGSAVTLLDWNGDGSLDIAVGGLAGRTAEIFVNDRNGGFGSAERLDSANVGNVSDMVSADLDNDGTSELVLAGSAGTVVMRGRVGGGFDEIPLSSGAGLHLAAADIELDGDQDIVVVRSTDRSVDVHYNDGDGTAFGLTRLNYGSVATVSAADLNGDGSPDLLLGTDGDDLNVPQNRVLYQQADGEFSAGSSFGASPVTALLSGDVDSDGWPDVVAVNAAGVHQVYLGSGGDAFALAPEQIVSDGMRRGVLSDFNSDESLDLIMVGRDAKVLEIHANNGIGRLGLGDRIAPDLQLIGAASVSIDAGQEFVDPGATAVDDIDGDISDQIVASGSIDPNTVGPQRITYRVADRAGNDATVTRTVTVGVNEGTGGGGGGAAGPAVIAALLLLLAMLYGRSGKRAAQ